MNLRAAVHGFLFSLSVVQSRDVWEIEKWNKTCAVEGGTWALTCRNSYRTNHELVELWFTRGGNKAQVDLIKGSNNTTRLWNNCNFQSCISQLDNLTKSDSGFYKLKFKTHHGSGDCREAVQLYVTDLRVEVINSYNSLGSSKIELKCQNTCLPPLVYKWFSNGQVMAKETLSSVFVPFQSRDSFSCALSRFMHIHSPAVYAPKASSASVTPSGEITAGMPVTLTCSGDANPAATFSWFKKGHSRNVSYGEQLVFWAVQPSDSGHYYCKAVNKLGVNLSPFITLDVKYAPTHPSLTNEGRTQDPDRADVFTGKYKYIVAGVITVVLLSLAFISVLFWIRKKRASRESSESEDRPDNTYKELPENANSEEQLKVVYASVHFINNQTESPYSNIEAHRTHRNLKEEDVIEYSTITLNSAALRS